jgi:hypothetical protein
MYSTSIQTSKHQNIERAMGTVRLIGGQVSDLRRGPRGSWTLVIDQASSRYLISLWDDEHVQHQAALNLRRGDIATLQVRNYEHPSYHPWKVWDVLNFSDADTRLITQLDDGVRANSLACQRSFQQAQLEHRQIGELQQALNLQEEERKQQGFWRQVAGISSGIAAIAMAPATGGASLLGLGGSAVMLSGTGSSTSSYSSTQLQHRREALGRNWQLMQQQALRALGCIDKLEAALERAKLQPWKQGLNSVSYGLIPPELRSQLQAVANSNAAPSTVTVNVSARSMDYLMA